MSIAKRLRILYAVFTQSWTTFTCPCGKEAFISNGAGKLLDGQLCEECEGREFDRWYAQFEREHERGIA
jgi:hypothetical protein